MFIRIVKLIFKTEKVETFLDIFDHSKVKITNTKGCTFLELYRDKTNPNIFFTYSHWETEQDLENYRNSPFFKSVWKETKTLFDGNPEVWSVDKVRS